MKQKMQQKRQLSWMEKEWAREIFPSSLKLVICSDEAHLNEGYSYDQSSFRGRFVEGVNGDDFCINFINKTRNIFALDSKLRQKTFKANE